MKLTVQAISEFIWLGMLYLYFSL